MFKSSRQPVLSPVAAGAGTLHPGMQCILRGRVARSTIFEARRVHKIVRKALCLFLAVATLVICMTGHAIYLQKLAVQGLFFSNVVVYLVYIMAVEALLPAWPGKSGVADETIVTQILMTGGHGTGLQ